MDGERDSFEVRAGHVAWSREGRGGTVLRYRACKDQKYLDERKRGWPIPRDAWCLLCLGALA